MDFINKFFTSFFKSPKIRHVDSSPIHPTPPMKTEDFSIEHIKLLRKLNQHPVGNSLSGITSLTTDIAKLISIFLNLELIEIASYPLSLECLNNDCLRNILRQFNLKVSGNKKELCTRILSNLNTESVKNCGYFSYCYILTPQGHQVINNFYNEHEIKQQNYINSLVQLILSQNFDEAYKIICKKNAESPLLTSIGFDWGNAYYRGLNPIHKSIYLDYIKKYPNPKLVAYAIYYQISETSLQSLSSTMNFTSEQTEWIQYISSMLVADIDAQKYAESGIESYTFLATLDAKTCPICGSLDGKIFNLSERAIGINCPPMHIGCRCTTVSYFKDIKRSLRASRNPHTGKTENIPYMTYDEWTKQNNL